MNEIYLDNAASTRPCGEAVNAMVQAMTECWGNPSSPHGSGTRARSLLNRSRRELAAMICGDPAGIVFTSGGTESNALALSQAAGRHVVISATEHISVLEAAARFGCEVTQVQPDSRGWIDPGRVEAALRPDTALVSIQAANNEVGTLQPIREIGQLLRRRRILFHCDAVQAFGRIPLDVEAMHIDLLSASAHKLHGPKGIGLLYMAPERSWKPLIPGSQQLGLRGGTEDIPAIAGFRAAAELCRRHMPEYAAKERELSSLLYQLLRSNPGIRFPSEGAERLAGILSVTLPGISAEAAIARLDLMGIRVSGGAACNTPSAGPSHVLTAMGLPEAEALRTLRISLSRDTTEEEIRTAAEAILGLCG